MTLSRRRTFKTFLITALLFFANSLSLRAQNDSFYNGKTVRIIVGFSPGGFYDRWARLLSRYMPNTFPAILISLCRTCPAPAR